MLYKQQCQVASPTWPAPWQSRTLTATREASLATPTVRPAAVEAMWVPCPSQSLESLLSEAKLGLHHPTHTIGLPCPSTTSNADAMTRDQRLYRSGVLSSSECCQADWQQGIAHAANAPQGVQQAGLKVA